MTDLDLSGFMPNTITLKLRDKTIEVSSDQPPGLMSQVNAWIDSYFTGNADPSKPVDMDVAWKLAEEICGQDMREIGTLGVVRLLTFFRDTTLVALQEIFSGPRYGSPESSMEESPSETSSEVETSSE